jgi:hypothetical protein
MRKAREVDITHTVLASDCESTLTWNLQVAAQLPSGKLQILSSSSISWKTVLVMKEIIQNSSFSILKLRVGT